MTNAVLKRSLVTSPRQAMEVIAAQFGAILPEGNDAGLAVVIDNMVPLNVAPVGTDRIALFCHLADVPQMTPQAWTGMLSEATTWGIDGETMRFTVLDQFVALMWSFEPNLPSDELTARLRLVVERAVAVARMIRKLEHQD